MGQDANRSGGHEMAESQNIEWKESWRDEYLKWICGFANAQGGKIYIGTQDDGTVIGVNNSKKLLEDIPNKIQNKLGITADVNLLTEDGLDYIEIVVNPWSFPVNYNGEYHYRSGSTKQLLRGNALTNFLMAKTGLKWDAATISNIGVDDLDQESFDIFRREALRSGRMTKEDLDIAKVFYRAGYIESWGRGIQKIRDACKNLGAYDPEYIVHGEDIMVKFSALQSAKVLDTKALNVTKDVTKDVAIEIKVLALLKVDASITTTEMARQLSVNRRTIQRGLDVLKSKGTIGRKGGKRYGYWEVYE